jgi:hypothetical protein
VRSSPLRKNSLCMASSPFPDLRPLCCHPGSQVQLHAVSQRRHTAMHLNPSAESRHVGSRWRPSGGFLTRNNSSTTVVPRRAIPHESPSAHFCTSAVLPGRGRARKRGLHRPKRAAWHRTDDMLKPPSTQVPTHHPPRPVSNLQGLCPAGVSSDHPPPLPWRDLKTLQASSSMSSSRSAALPASPGGRWGCAPNCACAMAHPNEVEPDSRLWMVKQPSSSPHVAHQHHTSWPSSPVTCAPLYQARGAGLNGGVVLIQ